MLITCTWGHTFTDMTLIFWMFYTRPHILDFDKFNGVSLNNSSLAQTFLLGWI